MKSWSKVRVGIMLAALLASFAVYWMRARGHARQDSLDVTATRETIDDSETYSDEAKAGNVESDLLADLDLLDIQRSTLVDAAKFAPFSALSPEDVHDAFAKEFESPGLEFFTDEMITETALRVSNYLAWTLTGDLDLINAHRAVSYPEQFERYGPLTEERSQKMYSELFRKRRNELSSDDAIEALGFASKPCIVVQGDPVKAFGAYWSRHMQEALPQSLKNTSKTYGFEIKDSIFIQVHTLLKNRNGDWTFHLSSWRWDNQREKMVLTLESMQNIQDPLIQVPQFYNGKIK